MKKAKSIILFAMILLLLLAVGCTAAQTDDTTEREGDNMTEIKIRTIIDDFLSGEITGEEFIKFIGELTEAEFIKFTEALTEAEFIKFTEELSKEEAGELFDKLYYRLGTEEADSLLDRLLGEIPPLTEEELEAQRVREEERRRIDVRYIVYGDFTPAADDIDLQTIERIVFVDGIDIEGGYSFVLDRMYGRVYYDPESAAVGMLEFIPYSAEFKDEDITRFIQVIEESGLRDWPEHFSGEIDEYAEDGGRSWMIGILFSDGTILRRSGSGMFWTDVASSPEQLAILTDFIKTIGAEVELRHKAETDGEN